MTLSIRRFQTEEDYWRIRTFLRQVFLKNGRRELSWQAYRFDYCRWHAYENIEGFAMGDVLTLWETSDGQIASVLNPENVGDIFIQMDPAFQSAALEEEMIAYAETTLSTSQRNNRRRLRIWAHEEDRLRQEILVQRGYSKGEWPEYQRSRPLSLPIDNIPLPSGYTVRSLGDQSELPARSWSSWRAFHPDAPDKEYEGWDWYLSLQRGPLYRRDLDIIAVTDSGAVAAFCTVWFDDVTRTGAFEPVGTVPEHRRQGLGKAVMAEGLRRLKSLGATMATVGSYTPPAHALYSSMGFGEYSLLEPWEREF